MALRQVRGASYGDDQRDIREELIDYSSSNGDVAVQFADATCICSGRIFRLDIDDTEGAAVRECVACGSKHAIGDSEDYLEEASLESCECPCGGDVFEVTAGVSLYHDSDDVRWLYLGCRCPACGLTACYGDWKNEFGDYREFLGRV